MRQLLLIGPSRCRCGDAFAKPATENPPPLFRGNREQNPIGFQLPVNAGVDVIRPPACHQSGARGSDSTIAAGRGGGEEEEEEEDFVLVMLIKLFIISIRIRPESS